MICDVARDVAASRRDRVCRIRSIGGNSGVAIGGVKFAQTSAAARFLWPPLCGHFWESRISCGAHAAYGGNPQMS